MTSPRLAECEARQASASLFPVWKTLVGQRGCPLLGGNQPHLPRNSQKIPNQKLYFYK